MIINDPNGAAARVNAEGRLSTAAVVLSEQSQASEIGEAFNFNTGNIVLTNSNDTPIFYIKNNGENRALKISRVFLAGGNSTSGTGQAEASIIRGPVGGTILTATIGTLHNFDFGSGKEIDAPVRVGQTGTTVTGGTTPIKFFFPNPASRNLVEFETIVLPRGSELVFTVKPPAGNTSWAIQAGFNVYVKVAT